MKLTRSNYPISLCFARTIHSCQGITCRKLVFIMGKTVFSRDMTYVAISRCMKFKGILMVNMNEAKFEASLIHNWDRLC